MFLPCHRSFRATPVYGCPHIITKMEKCDEFWFEKYYADFPAERNTPDGSGPGYRWKTGYSAFFVSEADFAINSGMIQLAVKSVHPKKNR